MTDSQGASDDSFARLPDPPYYAAVFSSTLNPGSASEYREAADRMLALARSQDGFLGFETARSPDGFGISVSYWSSLDAIARWRAHAEHRSAQAQGKESWYAHYEIRIAKVERAYGKR